MTREASLDAKKNPLSAAEVRLMLRRMAKRKVPPLSESPFGDSLRSG